MATRYKLYYASEGGEYGEEIYTKKDLLKYHYDKLEDVNLWECAELMMSNYNRTIKGDGEKSRYCYKLEEIKIKVLGSFPYYGLLVSDEMCKPEF